MLVVEVAAAAAAAAAAAVAAVTAAAVAHWTRQQETEGASRLRDD